MTCCLRDAWSYSNYQLELCKSQNQQTVTSPQTPRDRGRCITTHHSKNKVTEKWQKYRGHTTSRKPFISSNTELNHRSSGTKIILCQSDRKTKVWRKNLHLLVIQNTSVKHGEGSVTAWACMTACGTVSLIFIDVLIYEGGSGIHSEGNRNIPSANFEKWILSDWEEQNTLPTQQSTTSGGNLEGFRLVKLISSYCAAKVFASWRGDWREYKSQQTSRFSYSISA